jgi:uncharacterized membrane protein YciS (DUF1049 family)
LGQGHELHAVICRDPRDARALAGDLSEASRTIQQTDRAGVQALEKKDPPMIRLILVFILLALSLSFFLQSQDQEVALRYFFGLKSAETKVYVPILSGFVIGLLVSSILLFPAWVRGRIELRRKTKQLQEAEAELEHLREAQRGLEPDQSQSPAADDEPPA